MKCDGRGKLGPGRRVDPSKFVFAQRRTGQQIKSREDCSRIELTQGDIGVYCRPFFRCLARRYRRLSFMWRKWRRSERRGKGWWCTCWGPQSSSNPTPGPTKLYSSLVCSTCSEAWWEQTRARFAAKRSRGQAQKVGCLFGGREKEEKWDGRQFMMRALCVAVTDFS